MKKRILSILLLCCMVLTLLPTTAFAADELPDVKLSVPTEFDKTVDLTKQKGELKITDSKTYLIKGSEDPNWYFQYRIKIDVKNNTPHIFLDGVRIKAPKDGPAIELYNGASACLYFIGKDSELIGAENFAALQKNKTDGYLRVLVQTGTKLTCEGGRYGAGIGGSKVGIKKFSQGHGMNLHFGSLATGIYGGEILATSGVYGAGIGGGQGGVGEWIYVYSGKLTVRSVSEGAGIGGGQGGPGRFIYIKGGTVNAGSESGGAGIGSGDQDGQNKSEDAHHIEISGGTVEAWSNYAGAGIGGGRGGSGYDISITGGVVRAQGYLGAGIGGGMNGDSGNILIKDTTLTALAFPLYPSSDYTELSASAVGRGSNLLYYMAVMQDQEFAMTIEENIKIGASDGKSVWLSATGWQWRRNQKPYKKYWGTTTELLIPNENGRVDLQRLSLPYAYNYGRVISELELRCEESTCSHEFGWAIRDDCHIWACKKCGARDPAAEMSKQNGKHSPGDWSNQKQLCTVCDHVLERDTKAPVMETLTHGESYTVEDTLDGKPGAYTFTVSDPAASGEASSGVKSVTINDVLQALGSFYSLPAPDGSNNDAGAEYTVVATDNAGNETTATVRTYRRHHEHNYGDWSKDGTSHWHECTDYDCPNRNESIKDKAAHDYTDDADTTCNVCGYERTVTPPAPTEYTVTVTTAGNGTASASHAKAVVGTEITLTATPKEGYRFKEWKVMSGGVTIKDNKFLMPDSNVEVKAIFEEDAPPAPTNPAKPSISVTGTYTYNGSEHTAAVNGYDPSTMDIAGNTATDAGDYTVRVTSKTGKWADGSTDAVTAAWSIGKATQEAPIGLIGVAPSTEDGSDGKITGVTDKMEYRMAGESIYTACSGTEIENLSAGNYFVRYAEDNNHFAGTDAEVTVGKGAPLADCTITFDGNGGSGSMGPVTVKAGANYILPECGFTAPADQEFKAWEIGGTEYKVGDSYTVLGDTEIKALWENSVITPTTYTVTVSNDGNGTGTATPSTAATGTEITLTAMPKEGYHFKVWQVISGDVTITNDKFLMPNDNVEVKAIFEEDTPPAPTEFTVTVTSGGNGMASASPAKAVAGTEITLTAKPDEGYRFKEWEVISGGVTIKDDKFTMPSANVEVKAIFEKDAPPASTEFIVTFDGNGGTPSVSSMTTTDQKLTSLPSASRRGSYSFDGWYTEKSGGTKITTATVFSAKTTVYAHWSYTGGGGGGYNPPVTYYTLRFETGGGSDIPSVREAYNTYIDLTQYVPTWRGHTFTGWYSERSLTNKVSGVYLTKDMTVYAGWRVDENPGTGANPFTDVSEKDWFYGDVMFVYENGLMLGTSKTLFSPHGTATRGMMATILWRMEGSPAPKGKNSFTDVEAGKWYADAITWTAENGIFAGYGKDKFGPDDPITREQLAAIFYRYADYKGYDLTVKGNLDKFKDADKITDYAKTAMQWAVGSGLVKGKSGNLLDPQGTATRAEIAAMLHRFIEKYELVQGKAPGGLMGWIDPKRLQIPKTGDSSVLGLWGISLCTSLAGCLALTTWQIRRRREEEALQIIEK